MTYIFGFGGGCKKLREHIEYEWKVRKNESIINESNDSRRWTRCGQDVINQIDETQYSIDKLDLTLVCLFRET